MNTKSFFKTKTVIQKNPYIDMTFKVVKFQCPMCKEWFTSYTGNTGGLLQHITIIGKREVIAKALKEIKKTPHFNFWKKYTKPDRVFYKPRYWTI